MDTIEQARFNQLYEKHTNALILQGKSEKTIEMYSRSIRRLGQFFALCPDRLTTDQLKQYFLALVKSHSWSTVKVDRNAIQFFYQQVLPKGFRRARDYGFLHGLAKKTLHRIQLLLKVSIVPLPLKTKKEHLCPCCKKPMEFILFFKRPKKLIRNTT